MTFIYTDAASIYMNFYIIGDMIVSLSSQDVYWLIAMEILRKISDDT